MMDNCPLKPNLHISPPMPLIPKRDISIAAEWILWYLFGRTQFIVFLNFVYKPIYLLFVFLQRNSFLSSALQNQNHIFSAVFYCPIYSITTAADCHIFKLCIGNIKMSTARKHLIILIDDMILCQCFEQIQRRRADGTIIFQLFYANVDDGMTVQT